MKSWIAVVLGVAVSLGLAELAIGDEKPTSVDISSGWVFTTGDQPSWSAVSFRDSDWRPIRLGTPWEEQGHSDYNGFAWYRLHVKIPRDLSNHPRFQQLQALRLTLGKIDDVDETFFNGKSIGKTGTFPNSFTPAWLSARTYVVPAELIRWEDDNVIAVRVYDGSGAGGMYEGPYRLEIAQWSDFLRADFEMGRNGGVFFGKEGMPIAAVLRNQAEAAVSGTVTWKVENDRGKERSVTSSKASLPAKDTHRVAGSFSPTTPGFYRVHCAFRSEAQAISATWSKVLGYRPEAIESALTRESDFDEYWAKTLKALAAVEPNFKMVPRPSRDSETHRVYEVEMRSLNNVRVRGWYEQPKADGKSPALLRVPGYGQNMRPTGSGDPLVFLSFNIRGHGNSQDDVPGSPADYWIRGLDDKEGYFYQGAYADCVRAVDFLASRPEVDAGRIAVTGGSQGGGLSFATAALDPRISLCAPDIPFLCDWRAYFQTSDWPEINTWIAAAPHRSWESTLRTMSYFDALNFADRIKCPVFLGLGLQDAVCPPATIFAVYNRLPGQKEYRVYPHAGHWVDAIHHQLRRTWILMHFGKHE